MTTNQDGPSAAGAELKACPNPWCDLDEPSVSRNNALGRWTWQVECLCGISDGEFHETEAEAIAAWNTRSVDAGAAEPVAWMIETRDERWLAFEHENPDAIAIPFTETPLYTHPPENPPQRPSVVPDEVVEAVLTAFNNGMVDVPDKSNPRGFTTYHLPRKAIRAALTASLPAIRAQAVAEIVAKLWEKDIERPDDNTFAHVAWWIEANCS